MLFRSHNSDRGRVNDHTAIELCGNGFSLSHGYALRQPAADADAVLSTISRDDSVNLDLQSAVISDPNMNWCGGGLWHVGIVPLKSPTCGGAVPQIHARFLIFASASASRCVPWWA